MTSNPLIHRRPSSSWVWSVMLPAAVLLTTQLFPLATAIAQPCEQKTIIIDNSAQSVDDYTIPFSACRSDDPISECHLKKGPTCEQEDCNIIRGIGNITKAQFADDVCKGTVRLLPDDNTKFNVILEKESFTKTGVYKCTVSYQYTSECYSVFFHFDCPCSGQVNLDLTVEVVDLELSVVGNRDVIQMVESDGKETKFHVKDDSSVTLNCSLDFPHQLSATGTKLNFAFWSSTDPLSSTDAYNKTLSCNEAPSQDGNWAITRSGNTCYLTINFGSADNGQYVCYTYIPNDNDPYNRDRSNTISLLSATKLQPSTVNPQTLGLIVTVIIAVLICFMVFSVLSFVLLGPSAYVLNKFCRKVPNPDVEPERRPILHDDTRNNAVLDYSGAGSAAFASNLTRPISPDPFVDMHGQLKQNNDDKKNHSSEYETSFGKETPQHPRQSILLSGSATDTIATVTNGSTEQSDHQIVPTKQSSDSEELDPNITSDDQLTDLNRAADKPTPPSLRLDNKYVCKRCYKSYASDQKEFYTRHIIENRCAVNSNTSGAYRSTRDKNDYISTEEKSDDRSSTSSPFQVFTMDSEKS